MFMDKQYEHPNEMFIEDLRMLSSRHEGAADNDEKDEPTQCH